ncbi:MAG: CapA family protein [Deltaproteobacteria bacterium]|nr:MAG: CapA family protein [Deltaproteobacteria bacterium]
MARRKPFQMFLLTAMCWGTQATLAAPSSPPTQTKPAARSSKTPAPKTLTVSAVGDVMMGTTKLRLRARGRHLLRAVHPFLKNRDIVFYNNEGTFAKLETPPHKKVKPGYSYVFRSPQLYVKWLVRAGFNMASLANNHSYDYGWPGLAETIRVLRRAGIVSSHNYGMLARRTIRGTKVVMVAFHTSRYGKHNVNNIPQAKEVVQKLAKKYDIVIVSFHGGAEGLSKLHVPKTLERFLGERRGDVYRFAHAVIDAGADLVIGHGPHVPRAVEIYKKRLIAYSLGNFVTSGFGIRSYLGYAPLLQVEMKTNGELVQGKIISFRQKPYRGVYLDKENKVAKLMHNLGVVDFPITNALDPNGLMGSTPYKAPKTNANPPPRKLKKVKAFRP